jgi:hypothetical protein
MHEHVFDNTAEPGQMPFRFSRKGVVRCAARLGWVESR